MQSQMMKLFRGMFAIDLDNKSTLAYWATELQVTPQQLLEAADLSEKISINHLRLALIKLGYIPAPHGID